MAQSPSPRVTVSREDQPVTSSGSDHDHSGDDSPKELFSLGSPRIGQGVKGEILAAPGVKLDRKESYKAQRKNYRKEKKRVEKELLSTFQDETIIVLADWLKVRGTLKSWTKLWCVLKPGLLLLYRSEKAQSRHWIGTIILSSCELIERPSKKDGFCFKLFHPMDQSIWASKGPEGETLGAVVQPLPNSHLIFRAPTNAAGKCWMDALELALRCSSLLTGHRNRNSSVLEENVDSSGELEPRYHNESDVEKHFKTDLEDCGSITDDCDNSRRPATEGEDGSAEDMDDDDEVEDEDEDSVIEGTLAVVDQTHYEQDVAETFGTKNDQTEEFGEENKSVIWFLMKQVRPGMDLSRVVLPTFILEPRSFLDKLSDYYYHADIISRAAMEAEPFQRMKTVVQWYLSGFYKKPKGLKKPYNPILGETFRCYWLHDSGSKTFYLAEQVSHHPPISAFYATNRQDGFTISGTTLAKSKFYGNSTSAILTGVATLNLLARGEEYVMTMPYAHCKGILMGTMTMELGGKVQIQCEKTGYNTELEFKLRPFLGGGEFTNAVSGRLKLGKETLAVIDGHWDDKVMIKDKKSGVEETLWQVGPEVVSNRLKRFTVPIEQQTEWESARLWAEVGEAITKEDQVAATEEKTKLEVAQREALKDRQGMGEDWQTKLFIHEGCSYNPDGTESEAPKYTYKHADMRPWDPRNDMMQYESNYQLLTKTRHKTPMMRTQSIVSVLAPGPLLAQAPRRRKTKQRSQDSDTSNNAAPTLAKEMRASSSSLEAALAPLLEEQRAMSDRIGKLNHTIEVCLYQQKERDSHTNINRDLVLLVILVVMIQAVLNWVLTERAARSQV